MERVQGNASADALLARITEIMKVLIVAEAHTRARLNKVKGEYDVYGLVVRPGTLDGIRIFKIEDNGAEIELKEEQPIPQIQPEGGDQNASRSDSEQSQ